MSIRGKGKKEKGSLILPPITACDRESTSNENLQFSQNQAKQATGELWEMTRSAPQQASWRHGYNSSRTGTSIPN